MKAFEFLPGVTYVELDYREKQPYRNPFTKVGETTEHFLLRDSVNGRTLKLHKSHKYDYQELP